MNFPLIGGLSPQCLYMVCCDRSQPEKDYMTVHYQILTLNTRFPKILGQIQGLGCSQLEQEA